MEDNFDNKNNNNNNCCQPTVVVNADGVLWLLIVVGQLIPKVVNPLNGKPMTCFMWSVDFVIELKKMENKKKLFCHLS